MSYLHDEIDDEVPPHSAYQEPARELTLSTGTILGIFFGLALLCAVFFGFGYSMGSKTRSAPIVAGNPATPDAANFNSFSKPSAGSSASQPAATAQEKQQEVSAASTAATSSPTSSETAPIARTDAPSATGSTPVAPIRTTEAPASPDTRSAAIPEGSSVVQVAAVSHQEDADLLVNALKRKGYSVVARSEPQDKLFHIQIGPFTSKKDAEAMRQRLLADGYNAIVK